MPRAQSPIRIELTSDERDELERIARAHSLPHRAVVRAQVVLRLAEGQSIGGVAREVGLQRRIVRKWAERFDSLVDLEAKIDSFITEWNEVAHPFEWTPRSFDKVLASIGEEVAAAA
jgi:hypothetical protein